MIDNANKIMESGGQTACERIAGVNDNMCASHYHEFYELYYLESGERYHLLEDKLYLVKPGEFIIFEPYQLHHSYGDNNIPFSRLLIYFRKDIFSSDLIKDSLNGISGLYHMPGSQTSKLYNLLNQVLQEQEEQEKYYEENMTHLISQALIFILRNNLGKQENHEHHKVVDIISFINLNYMNQITLDKLSKKFFISQWHMCREFKCYTHITVNQYINKIRVIEAQKLLLENKKRITEIGYEVGFESITHFDRVFKQVVGTTPSQYKKHNS